MFTLSKQEWFTDLLKEVEGSGGFDGRLWRAFPSVEGGELTVGYGHKLKSPLVFIDGKQVNALSTPLTDGQITKLLQQDIDVAENLAASQYTAARNPVGVSWEGLSPVQKSMFTEIVFNVGTLNNKSGTFGWPKLAKGMKNNDSKTIFKELGRSFTNEATGEKVELTRRTKSLVKAYKSAPAQEVESSTPGFRGTGLPRALLEIRRVNKRIAEPKETVDVPLISSDLQRRLDEEFNLQEKEETEKQKEIDSAKTVPPEKKQQSTEAQGFFFEEGMFEQEGSTFEVIKVK